MMEEKVFSDKKLSLKYSFLEKLGQGSFGTVYRVLNKTTQKQTALKIEFSRG